MTLPAGPDLDAAVAIAMGWTDVEARDDVAEGLPPGSGPNAVMHNVPPYSTDIGSHTADMLEWLRLQSEEWAMWLCGAGCEAHWRNSSGRVELGECAGDVQVTGTTFQETIARLVVKVARHKQPH